PRIRIKPACPRLFAPTASSGLGIDHEAQARRLVGVGERALAAPRVHGPARLRDAETERLGMGNGRMSLGAAVPMIGAVDRVTGRLLMAQDLALPGMLHAAVVRSTVAHGRIVAIDTKAAQEVRGVAAVVTREEVRRRRELSPIYGPQIRDQPI